MEHEQSAEAAHASKGAAETTTPAQAAVELMHKFPHSYNGVAPANESVIVIDPDRDQQAFEGWGTSLCWFANVAGGYPDPQRNYLADLLFDPDKGLGLQICRYNIGGSGWGTLDVPNFRYGANVESFWGPSGEWDWTVDANQRWMLLAAKQRGASVFEAFSNTPPYWMTVSGRSSGNVFPWLDNLRPEYYDHFVHYLTEVVRWYSDKHDILFRTIAPFNEPSSIYWWAGNNQEGCHFDISTQNIIIGKLQSTLQDKGLAQKGVGISASDETSIDIGVLSFHGYTPATQQAIMQYNVHSYLGTKRANMRKLVKPTGKMLWMSEFGCGSSPPSDMGAALELSAMILRDMNEMQANAWIYWQAVENGEKGNWWGLMQVPFHTGTYVTLGKQFYAFKQYSHYIRNGASILHSSQPRSTLIATSGQGQSSQIVIVATNALIDYDVVNFDLSKCWPERSSVVLEIYRTSVTEDCQRVARIEAQAPLRYGCPLRPLSITTFVASFL